MKKEFINWCRNCHFDPLIAIKEKKGQRWMAVLYQIEIEGNFNIDDFKNSDDSWKKILATINAMSEDRIMYLHNLKYNL